MSGFYTDGTYIRDKYGRARIFRGINAVLKFPGADISGARRELKKVSPEKLGKIGVDLVRLCLNWASLEPERGSFSAEYAAVLRGYVKECESRGICVVPDMHQDLFSARFHGNGAPDWAVSPSLRGARPLAVWAEGYFYMSAVQQAFADFWSNKNGVQDEFFACWRFLCGALSGCENILGNDLFNEPYPHAGGREIFTGILNNAVSLSGGSADLGRCFENGSEKSAMMLALLKFLRAAGGVRGVKKLLKTLDDKKSFARLVDVNCSVLNEFAEKYYAPFVKRAASLPGGAAVLFEHCYFCNLGLPFHIDPPENSIYAPHAYDLFIDSPLYSRFCSNERIDFILEEIRKNQLDMNVPVLLGEWGGDISGARGRAHIEHIVDMTEKFCWSSAFWHSGRLKTLAEVNRPRPAAVNGEIKLIRTDRAAKTFVLEWYQQSPCSESDENANLLYIPGRGEVRFGGSAGDNRLKIEYE